MQAEFYFINKMAASSTTIYGLQLDASELKALIAQYGRDGLELAFPGVDVFNVFFRKASGSQSLEFTGSADELLAWSRS